VARDVNGVAVQVDVTSEGEVEALAEYVARDVGLTDILVTSAGVIQSPLPPDKLPMELWDRVLEVDLRGSYLTCRTFGEQMARRRGGSIITVASVTAFRSVPLHSYAPAKAAVASMTECLAAEWGRSGVRVNGVAPGYTLTPALAEQIEQGLRDPSLLEGNSALGRMVHTAEVAKAVAFLASDEASGITGITLPVDAGWLVAPSWHTYGGMRSARS